MRARSEDNIPVVVKWVFILFPMIPCRPILALIHPTAINARPLDHAGSARALAMLPSPDIHMATAAAKVKSVCMNVPRDIHRRVLHPNASPRRPKKAPKIKQITEQRAWHSVMLNAKSRQSWHSLTTARDS